MPKGTGQPPIIAERGEGLAADTILFVQHELPKAFEPAAFGTDDGKQMDHDGDDHVKRGAIGGGDAFQRFFKVKQSWILFRRTVLAEVLRLQQ